VAIQPKILRLNADCEVLNAGVQPLIMQTYLPDKNNQFPRLRSGN
jgi:hypothetical protein